MYNNFSCLDTYEKTLKERNVISFKNGVMLRGNGLCPRIYIYFV